MAETGNSLLDLYGGGDPSWIKGGRYEAPENVFALGAAAPGRWDSYKHEARPLGAPVDPFASKVQEYVGANAAAQGARAMGELAGNLTAPIVYRGKEGLGESGGHLPELAATALAGLISPAGARNLANAKIRHADDWGGTNRLRAAQEHEAWGSMRPDEMAEMWKRYGWARPETFGMHGMARSGAQPISVLAMPDFAVNEKALQPMKSGKDTIYRGEGPIPSMLHGVDDLMVAEPSLKNVPLALTHDPNVWATGGTMPEPIWKDNVKRLGDDPIGWRTSHVFAKGYDKPSLEGTVMHEVGGHATMIPQGIAPMPGQGIVQSMHPIRGTAAEAQLKDLGLVPKDELQHLAELRTHAGYLALAQEQAARYRKLVGNAPTKEIMDRYVPGLVDTYQPGAHEKGLENSWMFPLSDYRPDPEGYARQLTNTLANWRKAKGY